MVAGPRNRVDSPSPEDAINDDVFSSGASYLKDFEGYGEVSDEEGGLSSAGKTGAPSAPLEQMVCSEDMTRIDADLRGRVPDEQPPAATLASQLIENELAYLRSLQQQKLPEVSRLPPAAASSAAHAQTVVRWHVDLPQEEQIQVPGSGLD